jgi:hypothetical protein
MDAVHGQDLQRVVVVCALERKFDRVRVVNLQGYDHMTPAAATLALRRGILDVK